MTSLHLAASGGSDLAGLGVVIVAALVVAAGYAASCVLWPFAGCWHCDGTGQHRSPTGRAWRPCRRCRGTGARVRAGRQLVTVIRRSHHRATRPARPRLRSHTWRDTHK